MSGDPPVVAADDTPGWAVGAIAPSGTAGGPRGVTRRGCSGCSNILFTGGALIATRAVVRRFSFSPKSARSFPHAAHFGVRMGLYASQRPQTTPISIAFIATGRLPITRGP